MIVDLDEFQKYMEYMRLINTCDIDDLEIREENGKRVKVGQKFMDDWKYTGLSNRDFVERVMLADDLNNLFGDEIINE